jgi:hypothetical protein
MLDEITSSQGQSSTTTGIGHYDHHINNLQSQVEYKQSGLDIINQAFKKCDEGTAIIAAETKKNANLIAHQLSKIVGVEPQQIKNLRNLTNYQLNEIVDIKSSEIENRKKVIDEQLNEVQIHSYEIEKLKKFINDELNKIVNNINPNEVEGGKLFAAETKKLEILIDEELNKIPDVELKEKKKLRNHLFDYQFNRIANIKYNEIEKLKKLINDELNEMLSIDPNEIEQLKRLIHTQLNKIACINPHGIDKLKQLIDNHLDEIDSAGLVLTGFNEPALVAKQLKMLLKVDNKQDQEADDQEDKDEVMNEAQCFKHALEELPALDPIFNNYLDTITKTNHCFKNMPETDAVFINKVTPNENINNLTIYKSKLEEITNNLEELRDRTHKSSPAYCYVVALLQANTDALSYVAQFFDNRKLIDDTRIRLANETVDIDGVREKLGETCKILEFQANELKLQIAAALIKQTGEENRRIQHDNKENNFIPDEKKNTASSHQPSSSATSSTTLPLAQRSLNNNQNEKSDEKAENLKIKQFTMS